MTTSSDPKLRADVALEGVNPFSFAVTRLQAMFNDVELGPATGFFYKGYSGIQPVHWLVTNWHVLTGRNADNPDQVLHSKGALPNRLRVSLILRRNQPEYAERGPHEVLFQDQTIELYDADNKAKWHQHQSKNARDVGVVALGLALDRFHIVGINEPPQCNDMAINVGDEVFILGYPLGFAHFMNTPIWKRGSIASEPHLETSEMKSRVVIDATTRQGMSGGPVLQRAKTHYIDKNGMIKSHVNATHWIGIYASRPIFQLPHDVTQDDQRAEVGYFYKSGSVYEAITDGIPGPDYGDLP